LEIPPSLAAWLKRRDLTVDARAMHASFASRNPTLRCRDARGRKVFVKAAVRDDPGVAHERSMLDALQPLPQVPRVLHSTNGVLALEWLEGRTLWEARRRRGPTPDEAIGAALAKVQREGREATTSPVRGDLCERLLWTSPALFASLGPASLELFRKVHASRGAMHTLRWLLEGERREVLVHGDLRQPNIMLHRRKVTFIDWEQGGLGDPARDLGMLIAEDVRASLLPRDEAEVISRAKVQQHARALNTGWEASAQGVPGEHRARVLGWVAEALLRSAFTMAFHEAQLPTALVEAAIAILEEPAASSRALLGEG
jgi:thiamine kinase-like enzyme